MSSHTGSEVAFVFGSNLVHGSILAGIPQGGCVLAGSGLLIATAHLHCQHQTGCHKHHARGGHPRETV